MKRRPKIEPPKSARRYARRFLKLHAELPPSKRATTATGYAQAERIAAGKQVDAREIWAWFRRHCQHAVEAELQGLGPEDSKAIQASWAWGHWPMFRAAARAVGESSWCP